MAALSYDSAALLRHFAEVKGITYPLLSDPKSKVIRAFGILNDNFPPDHPWHGVPFPGTYISDEQGVVRAKYFEEDHRERYTASNMWIRQVKDGASPARSEVETRHLKLVAWASDSTVQPGNRILLGLDIELNPGMHVYSPGVEGGYIPMEWKIADSSGWLAHPAEHPPSRKLHLPAIRETVPVYEGRFRLTRDLTIGQSQEIRPVTGSGSELVVEGSLRYQACDEKMCYPPQTVPLRWTFGVERECLPSGQRTLQRKRRLPCLIGSKCWDATGAGTGSTSESLANPVKVMIRRG